MKCVVCGYEWPDHSPYCPRRNKDHTMPEENTTDCPRNKGIRMAEEDTTEKPGGIRDTMQVWGSLGEKVSGLFDECRQQGHIQFEFTWNPIGFRIHFPD